VENNSLNAIVQGGRLAVQGCAEVAACRNALIEKGLGALLGVGAAKTALDNLSSTEQNYVFSVALSGKADLIEKLTPEQRAAYDYMIGQDQKGLITIFPQPDSDLTGGKLVNPAQDQNKGTTLVTPDQRVQNGASHTGNTSGAPDTGGNTTVTPIPEAPNKDDFIYMSDGHMLGANGVKVPSKTIWKGEGKERIDVENPNPGQRPGQVHYQDNKNNKYYYNPNGNDFYSFDASKNKIPAPSSVNKLLEDPKFKQAIDKGMKQYLGEK
jgi:filamentous hemagglutinin